MIFSGGNFLNVLFCSFSLLCAAFWTCKLPFQRYLQHFWVWTSRFPENLQHFGARTVLRLRRLVKRFGARMHRQKRLRTNIACWHLVCLASRIPKDGKLCKKHPKKQFQRSVFNIEVSSTKLLVSWFHDVSWCFMINEINVDPFRMILGSPFLCPKYRCLDLMKVPA